MQTILHKIDELVNTLKALHPINPAYQRKFDKKIRLEFSYNSNHLEGNTLTYSETELLLIFDETRRNHTFREYEEMKAHDVAFQMITEWAKDQNRPLTETNIKNLNEIILVRPFWKDAQTPDGQKTRRQIKVGDYKEYPNSVRLQNGEIFEYPSPADTPILMNELVQWYRTETQKNALHPIELAALLHYRFVCIHPFDDGNGRISRLLMNYVLLKNNLLPIVIKSADKRQYLSALNSADVGERAVFINYIAEQRIWSLELNIKAAKGENIEEPDDIDKEVAVWKKQEVVKVVKAIHRNDKLIYELYKNGLEELFEKFEEKHRQFYDLFQEMVIRTFINNGSFAEEGKYYIKNKIDSLLLSLGDTNVPDTFNNEVV